MTAQLLFQLLPFLLLLPLGYVVGSLTERAHLRRLDRREQTLGDIILSDFRGLPVGCSADHCGLVTGEAVIASDYFKSFAARLRGLVGGEVRTFQTLMDRARREALLRMVFSAKSMGANRVINVRLATSNIGALQRRRGAPMAEAIAYGTAVFVPATPRR